MGVFEGFSQWLVIGSSVQASRLQRESPVTFCALAGDRVTRSGVSAAAGISGGFFVKWLEIRSHVGASRLQRGSPKAFVKWLEIGSHVEGPRLPRDSQEASPQWLG